MDLVVTSEKRPCPGETILGKAFLTNPGGKGANQAVAAARLGVDVTMLGCVGNDIYGKSLIQKLKEENVNVQYIKRSVLTQLEIPLDTVIPGERTDIRKA